MDSPEYILNARDVVDAFGCWPTFHDDEIVLLKMRTNPFFITLEIGSVSQSKKPIRTIFTFSGITKSVFEGFGGQNIIFSLSFRKTKDGIVTQLDSSIGLLADIVSDSVSVQVIVK